MTDLQSLTDEDLVGALEWVNTQDRFDAHVAEILRRLTVGREAASAYQSLRGELATMLGPQKPREGWTENMQWLAAVGAVLIERDAYILERGEAFSEIDALTTETARLTMAVQDATHAAEADVLRLREALTEAIAQLDWCIGEFRRNNRTHTALAVTEQANLLRRALADSASAAVPADKEATDE
jgi:hypothetical protein